MIYTFKINTTDSKKLKEQIEKYLSSHNLNLPPCDIQKLAYYIHYNSYMFVDEVQAEDEDSAWDKVDDERIIEELEITDIDDSDELEAEERAKARWESLQEDIYMDYIRGID